jgi:hypothetical protein
MQRVMTDSREALGSGMDETFAAARVEPRVSWGAILSGAVALLAVALLLWALALAIVSLAAHPTAGSIKGAALALWICAIVATLFGGLACGWVATITSGATRRRLVLTHAFLAWGVAFLVAFVFKVWMFRTALVATASTLVDAVAAQSAGPLMGPSRSDLIDAGRVALNYMRGAGWSWFGTWLISGLLTLAGAMFGARRAATFVRGEKAMETQAREPPLGPPAPMTPAPSR